MKDEHCLERAVTTARDCFGQQQPYSPRDRRGSVDNGRSRTAHRTETLTMCEDNSLLHGGGCLCGRIRYEVAGPPRWQAACHCRFCQRMTGSAFNAISYFLRKNVRYTSAQPTEYAYVSPVHGRALRPQFCPRCGVTVGLTLERNEAVYGILIGTFDAPDWVTVDKHIFVQSALHWDAFANTMDVFEEHSATSDGQPVTPSRPRLSSDKSN